MKISKKDVKEFAVTEGPKIWGWIAGSCASSAASAILTAVCPPVGIVASIGQIAIGATVGDKVQASREESARKLVDGIVAVKEEIEDLRSTEEKED